jgi:hypothetical protein
MRYCGEMARSWLFLDGFAIDVSHLPQLQMLTVNANARAKIEFDEL